MRAQLIAFAVLFVFIWLMHKPFDVHSNRCRWLVKLHEVPEWLLVALGVFIAAQWLFCLFRF